jgi:pimeloyl-ACP methyl ester carboxylesterase
MAAATGRTHLLESGRRIGYAEFGDRGGCPVFYFHGLPGSRLEAALLDGPARQRGLRIIAPDRPGFGLSDFQPGRTIADWPRDIAALADALGLDRFAVVANSGGGPYGAACARYLPNRVRGLALVCGLGPLEAPGALAAMAPWPRLVFETARRSPRLLKRLVRSAVFCIRRFPGPLLSVMALKASAADRSVLARGDVRRLLGESFREAVRQGERGGILELQLLTRPWGFRLEEIAMEVAIWYGGRDRTVPPSVGAAQAAAIPRRRVHFLPGEGHFSLPCNHIGEILAAIAPGPPAGADQMGK